MFRTAVPLGYFFVVLLLFTAFLAGSAILVVGWRRRSAAVRWAGATLCGCVVLLVVAEATYDSALELNPTIDSDARIVGTWSGGGQTVTLAADHTFTCQSDAQAIHGTWTRADWNLYLQGNSSADTMRFIQFRGVYRLLPHPLGDPDTWDGDLGLRLVPH